MSVVNTGDSKMARETLTAEDYARLPLNIRDTQRRNVYIGERVAATTLFNKRVIAPLEVEQAVAFAEQVLASAWLKKRYEHEIVVSVRPTGGHSSFAYIWKRRILFSPDHFAKLGALVVLHEIAHFLTPTDRVRAHGREFVKNYLELVTRFISREAAQVLRAELHARGVKVRGSDRDYYARQYKRRYERKKAATC
jgi:putative metallohydrolase (TIGR04338 family)